ncbi:LOW QUALITY PROTEIN: protein FAM178B [Hipposideros larvatus]
MNDMNDGLPSPPQLLAFSGSLGRMRPSSFEQHLGSDTLPPCQEQQPKASAELDCKVCYLCHGLLTLAGVVVTCQDITPNWGELQLCRQLDCHISTHVESPQATHQTKLKDLAAQTYICWPTASPSGTPSSPRIWEGREVVRH